MKVRSASDRNDTAINRIIDAVKKYAPPDIEFTDNEDEAELVIIYAYGFRRYVKYHIGHILEKGKKYAMVQLCVRSTPNPNTNNWIELWEPAEAVWSYYDLPSLCKEDGNTAKFNFYYAPLGVDSEIFNETPSNRKFICASTGSGSRFSQECKNEVILAAKGKPVFQLGEGESTDQITYSNHMDDISLAKYYSQCKYISGLHKVEGFELPVIEGLLCGARPICFDTPIFRHWFDNLAVFIPETGRGEIPGNLAKVFNEGARPVTNEEKEYVKVHFDWKVLVEGFWEKIKANEKQD